MEGGRELSCESLGTQMDCYVCKMVWQVIGDNPLESSLEEVGSLLVLQSSEFAKITPHTYSSLFFSFPYRTCAPKTACFSLMTLCRETTINW